MPDLILMDIQLPEISGLEVTKWLKEDDDLAHIPVVAVTAFAMKGDEERIREGGCEAYISKPISVSHFLDTIRTLPGVGADDRAHPRRRRHRGQRPPARGQADGRVLRGADRHRRRRRPWPSPPPRQPDIILLDVMMPGMDGFEVCRRLKDDPATRHIPVVLVTALDGRADRIAGLEAGADDFLTKPIDDVMLFARVRSPDPAEDGDRRTARARGLRPPHGRDRRRRRAPGRHRAAAS